VPRVVYDEQIFRSVVVTYEVDDGAFELMLRLRTDVELDDFGLVVIAVAEEGIEFLGLQ